ncbi:hypothetical protein [Kitasatospora sp. GP82]|uniref:hypothetical protein n=1 Tax=Kitasatospora sp. GP82 TaxID=3035089 RepID=UPI002476B202|nr:hypothetical protein [Kitasatospora sp. GP82]
MCHYTATDGNVPVRVFMSSSGLVAAGYNTVTIDDGWSTMHRTGQSANPVKTSYGSLQLYDAGGNPVSGTDGTGIDPTSGDLIPAPATSPRRPSMDRPSTGSSTWPGTPTARA